MRACATSVHGRGPVGVVWCERTPATKPGLLPLPCERGPVVEQPRGGSHHARVPRQSSSRGPAVVVLAVGVRACAASIHGRGPVGVVWCERTPATKPRLLPLPCERGPVVEQPRGGSHRARVPRQSSSRGPAVVVLAVGVRACAASIHGRGPVGVVWCERTPATKPGLLPLPCERGPVVEQPRGGSHHARVPRQSSSRGPAVVVLAVGVRACAASIHGRGPVGVVWCERTPATEPGLLPLPCERGPVVEQPRGGSHHARVPRQSSSRGPAVVVLAVGVRACAASFMAVGLLAWCGVNARQPPNRGSSHSRVSEARWWNSPVGVLITRACHDSPAAVGLLSWCWPWVCAPAPRQFMAVGLLAWCGVNARQPPNRGSSHSRVSEARWWNSPVGVLITRACHDSPAAVGLLSWCWPWVCAPAPRQFMAVGLLAWCGVNARQPPNRGSSHSHVSEARWWNSPVGVLITRACHDSPAAVGLLSWCWPWVCAPAPRQFMAVGLLAWCGVNARQPPNRGSSHSHVSEARWWNSPVGVLIARACHASPVAKAQSAEPA